MRYFSIILLWVIPHSLAAQNLVPNCSFEDLSTCPAEFSEIGNATPWTGARKIGGASSDLFNVCGVALFHSPDNRFGEQEPKDGNGYAGIWGYLDTYREYLQAPLLKPLISGKTYCINFYVSLAEYSWGGIKDIGALISVGPVYQDDYQGSDTGGYLNIQMKPQVTNEQGVFLTDTLNWIEVKGAFIAKGNEDHITIGNFSSDWNTSYLPKRGNLAMAYYYVDMVTLVECDLCDEALIELPADTTLCVGDTLAINFIPEDDYQYQWQDGSTMTSYPVFSPGLYWLDQYKNNCHSRDSIVVEKEDRLNPFDNGITSCNGEAVTLSFDAVGRSVLWNTGATESSIVVDTTGLYAVEIIGKGCRESDEVMVQFFDCIDSLPNVITPNDDGKNDYFVVEGINNDKWLFKIFNQWGTEVYANYQYDNTWNGSGLSTGVYYFYLRNQNSNKSFRGWVHVIFGEK
jgi:gliding motility-associated-like protein